MSVAVPLHGIFFACCMACTIAYVGVLHRSTHATLCVARHVVFHCTFYFACHLSRCMLLPRAIYVCRWLHSASSISIDSGTTSNTMATKQTGRMSPLSSVIAAVLMAALNVVPVASTSTTRTRSLTAAPSFVPDGTHE